MKMERHSKIVELIGKYEIETQEELAEYLNKEGYNVTQATVSRDIRELKLSKIQTENGGQKYAVFHPQTAFNDKYTRILHDSFVSMDMAQNFALLRIKPHAPPLVRVPVNSFEFHSCERTPQVEYLLRLLRHRSTYVPRHLVFIVYGVDYQGI